MDEQPPYGTFNPENYQHDNRPWKRAETIGCVITLSLGVLAVVVLLVSVLMLL